MPTTPKPSAFMQFALELAGTAALEIVPQFILHENLGKTLSERTLKLYRPVSVFTDPRSLVSFASFSFPYHWTTIQQAILQELGALAA